jgi:hypothetical protein
VLHSKVSILVLAVLVVGIVGTPSALAAPKWNVRGTALTGSEGITATFSAIGTSGLKLFLRSKLQGGKIEVVISCKTASVFNAIMMAINAGVVKFFWTGCKVDSASCKLTPAETTEIATTELSAETTDLSGVEPLYLKVSPKTVGGTLVVIKLIECAAEGEFKVFGTAACAVAAKATTEQALHLCQFAPTVGTLLTTLKFGTEPATIEGGASVTLVNGGNWSSSL